MKMIGCKKPTDVGDSSQTIQGPSRSGLRNRKMYLQHPVLMGRCDMIWYYYDIRMSCHILKKDEMMWYELIWVDMMWCHVTSQKNPNWPVDRGHSPGSLPHKSVWPDGLKMAHHLKPFGDIPNFQGPSFWVSTLVFSGDWPSKRVTGYDSPRKNCTFDMNLNGNGAVVCDQNHKCLKHFFNQWISIISNGLNQKNSTLNTLDFVKTFCCHQSHGGFDIWRWNLVLFMLGSCFGSIRNYPLIFFGK